MWHHKGRDIGFLGGFGGSMFSIRAILKQPCGLMQTRVEMNVGKHV